MGLQYLHIKVVSRSGHPQTPVPNLENEAWKAPGSPKWVLSYFHIQIVLRSGHPQTSLQSLENEVWKARGSPKRVF
jgi:hypothetical protein